MTDDTKPEPRGAGDVVVAYQQMAMTPEGQEVIRDLARRFGFTRQSTAPIHSGPLCPLTLAFHEGQRTVLVYIGRMLDADPKQFNEAYLSRGVD